MSEPGSDSTRRPPGTRGRRPLPALVFLLVLALAALGVWWNVLGDERARDRAEAAACSDADEAPPSLDPATVTLRVLNATDRGGLAGEVSEALVARGFVVDEVGNDDSGAEVTGVGELRFGSRGREAADFLTVFVPGVTERPDTRADARVDVVLGPDYAELAPPEQVAAALAPAASADPTC
ncbi:LytR C-terminal domain-containing protein [Modestobacter roseus]|uniref:LytR cell envelope-related transcriptional attenuator n=1 Tax=Modestobacter roseus TaxID=1181884 RepID=A0A562IRY3_9ACTN|nr:LytR C-terminal domain-containing protein [Modestobacter roseus]MQA31984.1 LytR family transcriptional regulator [Modestobacter roseus]TWH73485.1 LytR cell envelope-related transcriptional attenuator [Modestobacter roseus]